MTAPAANLTIDGDRLWDSLMEMARIGPGIAGGNNRQSLTDEDAEGRALFQRWCEAEGLTLSVDRIGNMFARREGIDPSLPPVCVGSHLDTQPTGGKYDGVLGTLAGLEIIRSLNARDIATRHPIVVVNWTNEEGSRFAPSMTASGVFAGRYDLDWALDLRDGEGLRFGDELSRIGWAGDAPVGSQPMKAFFELHIEQGPILEDEGVDIGVVTRGQGKRWRRYTITGQDCHTGTTPMPARRDAGLAAARIAVLTHEVAMAHQPDAVGAMGHVELSPNSPCIVAGQAVCTIDIRSPDLDVLTGMQARVDEGAARICEEMGLSFMAEDAGTFDPVTFDAGCVDTVRRAAERLGYSHRDIVSGAGHDACFVNDVVPTAMVFCPCVGGLSHNEAEEISPEWAAKGANVLFHAVVETAEIVR
ncbi:Zn-dependent hydrolase [Rhodobacteraceae bacterium NNCM2]|nr:Zn-dependent hydrolase [Coraliihabitans acroporae]